MMVSLQGKAQVLVTVSAEDKSDCSGLTEVVLSRGEVFLFHTSIPVGGNAEFKLVPGKYQVRTFNEQLCSGFHEFEFKGEQISVSATLSRPAPDPKKDASKRKPANFGYMSPSISAGIVAPQNPWFGMWGMPYWYPFYNPWYSNFNSPCAWYPGYCMGPYYPSGGPIAMGKPNLYFQWEGKPSQKTPEIDVRLSNQTTKGLMASSPAHLEKGWQVRVHQHGVEHGGVTYPYLFYDLRTTQQHLQLSSGFCGEKEALLKQMDAALETRRYPKGAIKDFRDYWSVHFPAGHRYCVLPQLEKEMNLSAPIEFSKDLTLVRSLFLVLPDFGKGPKRESAALLNGLDLGKLKSWKAEKALPAARDGISAYEWGLAFLFSDQVPNARTGRVPSAVVGEPESVGSSGASGVSDTSRGSNAPVSQ